MALRSRNKVSSAFSMSSMTDIVFLLLIFFMLTSSVVTQNAIKVLLPQSETKSTKQEAVKVYIKYVDEDVLEYYVGSNKVDFNDLEFELKRLLDGKESQWIEIHGDKRIRYDDFINLLDLAKANKFNVVVATQNK